MHKRILAWVLALMLLGTAPLTVRAHEVPDDQRLGSVTLSMTYRGEPLPGGSLTLYRVAEVATENGDYFFEYTADFAECEIAVEELLSAQLPGALAAIAAEKGLTGTTGTADETGKVRFTGLEIGLYLIVQEEAAPGFRRINPFLVSVPRNDDGHYVYDVETAPKNVPGPEPEPTEPPTEPIEPGPELPQTGQNNWPVPVLAVTGMLLILAGLLCMTGRKKRDEA